MKNKQIIAIASISAVILLIVIALIIGAPEPAQPDVTDAPTTTGVPVDYRAVYADAVALMNSTASYVTESNYIRTTIAGNESFSWESSRLLQINGQGSGKMSAYGNETLTSGDHVVEFTLGYINGNAYMISDGKQFHSSLSEADFLNQNVPAVLLDEALYTNLDFAEDSGNLVLTFTQATEGESWAMPLNSEFLSAEGCAVLDGQHRLVSSTYTLTCLIGNVKTEIHINNTIRYTNEAFTVPVYENSTQVATLDSIRILEIACGHLMQAESVSAVITENISCQAYGDNRKQITQINMDAIGTNCAANIDIETTHSNTGKADAPTHKRQQIQYLNSQYTQTIDGQEPVKEDGITPYMMKTHCQDYFLSTLLLSRHITGAEINERLGGYRYEFSVNDAYALSLFQSASQILYQDAALLLTVSEDYSIDSATAYLLVDKYTGLPVISGIACKITHSVGGFPYTLSYDVRQQYTLSG